MIPIAKETDAKDAPHIIDEVRIIELHAPAFGSWRECTQHQQSGILGQKRFKRMTLNNLAHAR